ncbi:MAG: tripartite tricarboxylate transporter TctB family protein [Xanthobacteraceae bacterium]
MSDSEIEINVEDPDAPSDESPVLARKRGVEVVTMAVLMALALVTGADNWRTGIAWSSDGPAPGSFPFYLSVILFMACGYGLAAALRETASASGVFVTRDQLRRVAQVFLPTLAFCFLTQWLGLYVASFLLIAGFMMVIGKVAAWKSVLTGFVFALVMFVTFQIAFDVIMPKGPLEALLGY